ncbi:hypothetical protein FHW89_001145 [Mucilaginibacter sp. SG564]|nr:hypothetical protein [Mucilaginibacter sp. SG564]
MSQGSQTGVSKPAQDSFITIKNKITLMKITSP